MKTTTILIVEDDFIVAKMLEQSLVDLGYHVAGMASTGQDAIDLTGKFRPSLVLLDIRLWGDMDGIEAARLIHERYHTPVVYLTAHSDDATFNRAIGTSLYGYLIKPVTHNALQTTIEVALEKYRIEESLRQANRKLSLLSSITRHDILNTLTALIGSVDLARMTATDPAFLSHLEKEGLLLSQIHRQVEFTRDYESLGMDAPLWQGVKALIDRCGSQILPQQLKIETRGIEDIEVCADPLFEKVIYNLVDNAVRHGKNISFIRFVAKDSGSFLTLICEDDGGGIAPGVKEKIFERGFGRNTGLGLFLVREILEITGFSIVENGIVGKGARFEIRIPSGMYRA
ncbi:MAG TPA: response regulator [Methanoregulaceae archaeon]|nr:response regulator [Methanoregulaceae archaeon]HPD74715.1 response regulator [Methanoregulaceae archaeon]